MNTCNPAQIYNVDETGMPLDARLPNVTTKCGQKRCKRDLLGKLNTELWPSSKSSSGLPRIAHFKKVILKPVLKQFLVCPPFTMYLGPPQLSIDDSGTFSQILRNRLTNGICTPNHCNLVFSRHSIVSTTTHHTRFPTT